MICGLDCCGLPVQVSGVIQSYNNFALSEIVRVVWFQIPPTKWVVRYQKFFLLLLPLLQSLSKRHKAAGERNEETEHLAKESTTLQCVPEMNDKQLEENKVIF